jgi:hypothetical protein
VCQAIAFGAMAGIMTITPVRMQSDALQFSFDKTTTTVMLHSECARGCSCDVTLVCVSLCIVNNYCGIFYTWHVNLLSNHQPALSPHAHQCWECSCPLCSPAASSKRWG